MEKYDLILLHPPSIFDFRQRDDVLYAFSSSSNISVSLIYEMYPLGFKAIETYLRERGKKVTIINLADMMLKDHGLDVDSLLKNLNAKMIGIDLHWLAHTQGSLAVAKKLKEYHPDVPLLFGGIAASYYCEKLIEYPQVDFVLSGVDTPLLVDKLIDQLDSNDYGDIPNLCWKGKGGEITINETSSASEYNSAINWAYSDDSINYLMLFSGAGCEYSCTFCSGSKYAMKKHWGVNGGFVNKNESVFFNEVKSIKNHGCKNTTLITLHHWFEDIDLLKKVLDILETSNITTMHYTIFKLLSKDHIRLLSNYNIRPFFEISLQSSAEKIRRMCGNPSYSNSDLESWLDTLYAYNRTAVVALFFMIGLPEQTPESVMEDIHYINYLMDKYKGNNLNIYMSPMRPFLDPGSHIYDNPEKYGYKIFFNELKDYEKALIVPHWRDSLNYETKWISRDGLVDITYKTAKEMVLAKQKYGKFPKSVAKKLVNKLDSTVDLLDEIGQYDNSHMPKSIRKKILEYNNETLLESRSLQSPANMKFYKFWYE